MKFKKLHSSDYVLAGLAVLGLAYYATSIWNKGNEEVLDVDVVPPENEVNSHSADSVRIFRID